LTKTVSKYISYYRFADGTFGTSSTPIPPAISYNNTLTISLPSGLDYSTSTLGYPAKMLNLDGISTTTVSVAYNLTSTSTFYFYKGVATTTQGLINLGADIRIRGTWRMTGTQENVKDVNAVAPGVATTSSYTYNQPYFETLSALTASAGTTTLPIGIYENVDCNSFLGKCSTPLGQSELAFEVGIRAPWYQGGGFNWTRLADILDTMTGRYSTTQDFQLLILGNLSFLDAQAEIDNDKLQEIINAGVNSTTTWSDYCNLVGAKWELSSCVMASFVPTKTQTLSLFDLMLNGDPVGTTTVATGSNTVNMVNNANLQIGDTINTGFPLLTTSQNSLIPVKWRNGTTTAGALADVVVRMRLTSITYDIIPTINNVGYLSNIDIRNYIPKDISQADFIKAFVQMYNLFIDIDPNEPNKLIIKTRDKYYDDGNNGCIPPLILL